jgi:GAF domain-containing protein
LRPLDAATESALSRLGSDDFLDELLDRARDLLRVDTAAVLLFDPTEQMLVAAAARGIERMGHHRARMPAEDSFARQVVTQRRPLQINHIDSTDKIHPILTRRGITSIAAAPVITATQAAIGIVQVGTLAPRKFTEADIALLTSVTPLPAETLCRAITATFLDETTTDDVAVLAVRRDQT